MNFDLLKAGLSAGKAIWGFFSGRQADKEQKKIEQENLAHNIATREYQASMQNLAAKNHSSSLQANLLNIKVMQAKDIKDTAEKRARFDAIASAEMQMIKQSHHLEQRQFESNVIDANILMTGSSLQLAKDTAMMNQLKERIITLKHEASKPEAKMDDAITYNNIAALEDQLSISMEQQMLSKQFQRKEKEHFSRLHQRLDESDKGSFFSRTLDLASSLVGAKTAYDDSKNNNNKNKK